MPNSTITTPESARNSAPVTWRGLGVLCLLLAACDIPSEPSAASTEAVPLPPEVCSTARTSLDQLVNGGAIIQDQPGSATIDRDVWLAMDDRAKNGLVQALGLDAMCQSATPVREADVTLRDEGGTPLRTEVVPAPEMRLNGQLPAE